MLLRRAHCLLVAMGLWTTTLTAQERPAPSPAAIKGTVVSGISSHPIAGAFIELRPTASGRRRLAVADSIGGFAFDSLVPGSYRLQIRRIGYPVSTTQLSVVAGESFAKVFVLSGTCTNDSASALQDIALGHPKILLHGGLAPVALSDSERAAAGRYHIEYVELGDMITNPDECDDQYNRVVLRYLDRAFGTAWRQWARLPDAPPR